jgi:hypothetical protein
MNAKKVVFLQKCWINHHKVVGMELETNKNLFLDQFPNYPAFEVHTGSCWFILGQQHYMNIHMTTSNINT